MNSVAPGKSTDQFQTLLDTVENLREAKYPHLDKTLVRDILRLHTEGRTSDAEIARSASQAAEQVLRDKG